MRDSPAFARLYPRAWRGFRPDGDRSGLSRNYQRVAWHVAGPLHHPFVGVLKQDASDQAPDRGHVGEDADDLGATFDLMIRPLDWVGAVQHGAMRGREAHASKYVFFGRVHQRGELGHRGTQLIGHTVPLARGRSRRCPERWRSQ